MNKFTAATLIGAASAAPGPAVDSGWPKFATVAPIASTDLDTTWTKAEWSQQAAATLTATVGPCRAVRSDHFAVLTQAITAVQTGPATGAVANVSGTVRAFWNTVLANIGTYAPKLTNATTANGTSDSYWAVCKTVDTSIACNSYVNYVGTAQTVISNRLVYKVGAFSAANYISGTSGNGNFIQFNNDLLMASLYHEADAAGTSTATTDGSKWCSPWDTKVTKDGAAVPVSAMYGLTGRSKCTWFLTAEDNTVGLSFKVLPSDQFDFDMQWFEFAGSAALESASLLPATSVADFFLGDYGANTNGAVSLNPQKAAPAGGSGFVANAILRWAEYSDPAVYPGGSIGDVQYFPGLAGDQKESQQLTMNQYNVASMYSQIVGVNNAYNSAVATYNPLREAYDSALTAETARLADALKAAFDPMITIPERPCAPIQPAEYSGVYLELAKANLSSGNTQPTTATTAGKMGWLVRTLTSGNASNNTSSVKASIASGFVYLVADDSASSKVLQTKAGHVFGRLGQNDMTIPEGDKPFVWAVLGAATEKAAMMLSIFPTTDASTGIATTKTFQAEFKGMAWAANSDFNKPGRPGAATNPMATGATMLSLGVASAVVISTLA